MELRVQDPDPQLADVDGISAPDVRNQRFSGPLVDVDLVHQSLSISRYLPVLQRLAAEDLNVQSVLISLHGQQFDQPRLGRLDRHRAENQRRHPSSDGAEQSLAGFEIAALDG